MPPRRGWNSFWFVVLQLCRAYGAPLATAGKSEIRKYKVVFFIGKSEIGLESDVAEATAKP